VCRVEVVREETVARMVRAWAAACAAGALVHSAVGGGLKGFSSLADEVSTTPATPAALASPAVAREDVWATLRLQHGSEAFEHAKEERALQREQVNEASAGVTGRAFVFIAKNKDKEPRLAVTDTQDSQQIFGVDVENWNFESDEPIKFKLDTLGYPIESIKDISEGEYWIQTVFQPYQFFSKRPEPVWLPKFTANRFEGGRFSTHPGVLYSTPQKITIRHGETLDLTMTEVQPEDHQVDEKDDTKWIKHFSVRSKLLSDFWGVDVVLRACILVPYGWHDKPDARYPLMLYHGHYHDDFATPGPFVETPADESKLSGYDLTTAQYAYAFYKNWTNPSEGPFVNNRALIMTIKHENPYYDDSYAVNTENMGPYGDAIMEELLPAVEKKFRAIGEGWARMTYGGSTGGWESLAVQIMYPDSFNGCYSSCPDPISFEQYTTVNIYNDTNAYVLDGDFKNTERPAQRGTASNLIYPGFGNADGIVQSTQREVNQKELVIGTHGRSGNQWDVWQATFGPRDRKTGFLVPIWDKRTGVIDRKVAEYWRENFDLTHIVKRDWHKIGHKLAGKMNVAVGSMDTFYLNNAVYRFEEMLATLSDPLPEATITYGTHDGRGYAHCYGGQEDGIPNSIARLTENTRLIPKAIKRMLSTAPAGADTDSWQY